VRIAVAATPGVAIPTLEWLLASEHQLDLIITQPDRPSGRGQKTTGSSVSLWARERSIELIKPETPSDLIPMVSNFDLVITIGYGVILPENLLNLPAHGFLNLHFSLLPAYRGAAPVQRALENGEVESGVTVFKLDKGLDTGPIYSQRVLTIEPTWRSFELLEELSKLGVVAIADAIGKIDLGIEPLAQMGSPSYAPKISKIEAKIDFVLPADTVLRKIRAFTYEPGAWTLFNKDPFKISDAREVDHLQGNPGEVSIVGQRVIVSCGESTSLEILKVTPSGKREMNAIDWSRGARLDQGASFG
jgi:methionyl-tRNA formyltransferase